VQTVELVWVKQFDKVVKHVTVPPVVPLVIEPDVHAVQTPVADEAGIVGVHAALPHVTVKRYPQLQFALEPTAVYAEYPVLTILVAAVLA